MVETNISIGASIHNEPITFVKVRRDLELRLGLVHIAAKSASRSGALPKKRLRTAACTLWSSRILLRSWVLSGKSTMTYERCCCARGCARRTEPHDANGIAAAAR